MEQNWWVAAWKKFGVFEGRARRKEYWYFRIEYILILGISWGLFFYFFQIKQPDGSISNQWLIDLSGLMAILLSLLLTIPDIAVTVRRLHDTNNNGWLYLLRFIPYIGGLILLAFMFIDSTPGQNKYGPNPKLFDAGIIIERLPD